MLYVQLGCPRYCRSSRSRKNEEMSLVLALVFTGKKKEKEIRTFRPPLEQQLQSSSRCCVAVAARDGGSNADTYQLLYLSWIYSVHYFFLSAQEGEEWPETEGIFPCTSMFTYISIELTRWS